MTRRLIERELDTLQRRLPHRWWTPYAVFGAALGLGVLVSRVPFLRLVKVGARALQTGVAVASAVAAVDRFVNERRRHAA